MSIPHRYQGYIIQLISSLYILLFTYAAVSKLLDFENFRIQLAQSPLLSAYAGIVAPGIIILELLLALLLAFRPSRFIALILSYFLMVAFTAYIYIILHYSDFIPCSCGGILEKLGWTAHMVFNIAFALLGIAGLFLMAGEKIKKGRMTGMIVLSSFLATGMMGALFLSSEHIMRKENNFTRRYIPHALPEEKAFDLKFNSYYFAGYSKGKVYLGNYTAPLVFTTIDSGFTDTENMKIVLDDTHHPFRSILLMANPPFFYAYDGSVPVLYRGSLGIPFAKTISNGDAFFSQLQITGKNSFAFRTRSSKEEKNVLGTLELQPQARVALRYDLLEKQSDGVFDTDGLLLKDHGTGDILYSYYYRNGFMVMDSSLNLLRKLHTIDTISHAQVKAATLSKGEHKLGAPPLLVNKNMVVHNQVLFVESRLKGKFESQDIWDNASVIDMYQTSQQSYLGSFFIQNRGADKMGQMLVTDEYLFVLSGTEILRYRFAQAITKYFKKGEAEKPHQSRQ